MLWLYNIALLCYTFAIRIAALFHPKAKQWINGRKTVFKILKNANFQATDTIVWIHAASLGEFEQGRPIIEQLKEEQPNIKILLTFFSPSGYEIQKNYALADLVLYLPIDSKDNARQFIKMVNPQLVIFIKYELWYHFLHELQTAKIPTLLVSALFRENQFFFKPYGQWFKKVIQGLDCIFVQNKISKTILEKNAISKVSIAGDTRVDRVAQIKEQKKDFPIIRDFTKDKRVLICGSTWPADEEILQQYIHDNPKRWSYIIAPHDISPARISYIENLFQTTSIRYSQAAGKSLQDYNILIIDNIGMLSSLYQYGTVAYIGGAFEKGLHNVLEPIAFGLPVIFGSRFQKFEEANWLVKNGGGFSLESVNDLNRVLNQLEEDSFYQQSSKKAFDYIQQNQGATKQIIHFILKQKYLNPSPMTDQRSGIKGQRP